MSKWKMVKLRDACTVMTDGDWIESKDQALEGIRLIQTGNIGSGVFLEKELKSKYINEDTFTKLNCKEIFPDDVLVSRLPSPIGRACIVPSKNERLITAVDCTIIRFNKEKYINKLFVYYSQSKRYQFQINRHVVGATRSRISRKNLETITIPNPQLEDQKYIVETLDKVTEIIDLHKKRLDKLDSLIKSIFNDMFGNPVINEKGWEKKKLSEVCDIVTGNTPPRNDKNNYGEYIEWIKSDNITNENTYLTEAVECLSENGLKIGRSVDKDTILMTCIAGSIRCIGNVAIANRKVAFNQQINAIIPLQNNVYYLYVLFLQTQKYIQSTINMSLKGILSKGKLSSLEFIMPSIELQNKFAQIVKKIEEQKILEKQAISKSENLFNSLMSKYFD